MMMRYNRIIIPNSTSSYKEKKMINFTAKIILITGAGSGTGRQLAEQLAARGAVIAAVDLNPLGLDETVAKILTAGGRVKDYLFDTAKRLPVVALVDEVLDDWGRIDILILAAEVHPSDPILTMDEWDFHRTLDVNLAGPFFLMQRLAQVMIKQDRTPETNAGVIVVVGDARRGKPARRGRPTCLPKPGEVAYLPLPGEGAAYLASQAALAALTQAAAQEFKAYNIQVMGIENFRLLIED
jgi:NAD(P)-dependent dehydrogenase (short-subunit alcohol dehydrogenase family)